MDIPKIMKGRLWQALLNEEGVRFISRTLRKLVGLVDEWISPGNGTPTWQWQILEKATSLSFPDVPASNATTSVNKTARQC